MQQITENTEKLNDHEMMKFKVDSQKFMLIMHQKLRENIPYLTQLYE